MKLKLFLTLKPLIYKGFLKKAKKFQKNLKKGVDKVLKGWYYSQARSRATNLENDTESIRNANDSQ